MHRMTIAEAVSYMRGQDRRSRQAWEQTRVLAGLVHKVLTGEDFDMSFPWDGQDDDPDNNPERMSKAELEDARAKARAMEEWMNRRGGNL